MSVSGSVPGSVCVPVSVSVPVSMVGSVCL